MSEDLATGTDYDVLARLVQDKWRVFEFGSFMGGSALAMLRTMPKDSRLYCIDHFLGNRDDPCTAVPRREMLDNFLRRTEPYWSMLTIIVGGTEEAIMFPRHCADMCFIDASHDYEAVAHDIACAKHLVRIGGIICGHDYIKHYEDCDPELIKKYSESPDGGFEGVSYGVIRAVHEAFGKPEHEGAVWWVKV